MAEEALGRTRVYIRHGPYERDLRIHVCRGLRQPMAEVWPRIKHYD